MSIDVKKTQDGTFYIHDYVPVAKFHTYSEKDIEMAKRIWAYKDGEEAELFKLTNDLAEAIKVIISDNKVGKNIGLVAAPSSKTGKESAVAKSIERIRERYLEGENFGNHVIYDYSGLLQRVEDVPNSHKGQRVSYGQHMETIECMRQNLSRYWTTFIIIDDVTTTGTMLEVCKDIMIENGANEDCIYKLAVSRTV